MRLNRSPMIFGDLWVRASGHSPRILRCRSVDGNGPLVLRRKYLLRTGGASESFICGDFAKSSDVVYGDAFTSRGEHAALLPLGEQAAHGKQSRAGHLG